MQKKNIYSSGFTLIEIIIAITILAMMMIGVYSLTTGGIETKDSSLADSYDTLELEAAMSRIELDFMQIYSPLYYSQLKVRKSRNNNSYEAYDNEESDAQISDYEENQIGLNTRFQGLSQSGHPIPVIENPDKSTLSFMTFGHQRRIEDIKQSNFAWVKYTLENDSTSDSKDASLNLVRYYTATNPYDRYHNWEKIRSAVLFKRIKDLRFYFWNEEKKKYVTSIKDLGSPPYSLNIIKVHITWVDSFGATRNNARTFRSIWPKQIIDDKQKASSASLFPDLNSESQKDE